MRSGAEEFMFEGLMQPMHLLVILVSHFYFLARRSWENWARGLGDGIRHFKNAVKEGSEPAGPAVSAKKPQEQK
jgi:Sec-independent protein translocase protein TatA